MMEQDMMQPSMAAAPLSPPPAARAASGRPRRGGRPRLLRDCDGTLRGSRAGQGVFSPDALRRKAELLGVPHPRTDAEAEALARMNASALDALLQRGLIDEGQYWAGVRAGMVLRRWASLAGIPPRHPAVERLGHLAAGPERSEAEQEACWLDSKADLRRITAALRRVEPFLAARSVVETVVMDDLLPPALLRPGIGRQVLSAALSALRDAFARPGAAPVEWTENQSA